MKKCTWCGKEYSNEDLKKCLVDGQPLSGLEAPEHPKSREPSETAQRPIPRMRIGRESARREPRYLNLSATDGAFTWQEGYSRPDWAVIRKAIEQSVAAEHQSEAWDEAAVQWAQRLRSDLGGDYAVQCSNEFVLLSPLEAKKAVELLDFAELTLEQIYDVLREAAWQCANGKHVILVFEDQEDYYQYIAYYYREGTHPASGGCLIHKDYVHIAMPYGSGRYIRRTLSHELLHNSVVHLSLPLWLNEGLAMAFSRNAADLQRHILDDDVRDRHLAFWNAATIQEFWAGTSFGVAGDPCELSYSLAEILFHLTLERAGALPAFVNSAQREDAGQSAALDVLGVDLGQLAGTFLGAGEWRPNRKAIAQLRTPPPRTD